MGSVAKRSCTRGERCTKYRFLGEPAKVRSSSKSDLCDRCLQEYADAANAYSNPAWMLEVDEAITAVSAERPYLRAVGRGSLWDLFGLDTHNGGWGKQSDRGEVLMRLDANTLTKLRDWLDENRGRAVERYGYYTWLDLRTKVGLGAWLAQLPPDMKLLPDAKDGLPFQAVAVRTDDKKWDLNAPIRAELLRRSPRYFSERDMAKLLDTSRSSYRRLRERTEKQGLTLDKFTADILERMVRGENRGPKRRP
jgi:hypothetical protein